MELRYGNYNLYLLLLQEEKLLEPFFLAGGRSKLGTIMILSFNPFLHLQNLFIHIEYFNSTGVMCCAVLCCHYKTIAFRVKKRGQESPLGRTQGTVEENERTRQKKIIKNKFFGLFRFLSVLRFINLFPYRHGTFVVGPRRDR